MAERRIVSLTLDTLDDLPKACRTCVFWELAPIARERTALAGDPGFEKEAWASATLLQWGSCGRLAYIGEACAGYVLYSTASQLPRASVFPTRPVSADAALLATGFVHPDFAGQGIGRALVQAAAKDLAARGYKAIEAFGEATWSAPRCVLPADFLRSIGFKTIRHHPEYPLLRLELHRALDWQEDVAVALDQLLSTMAPSLTRTRAVGAPLQQLKCA